MSSSGPKQKLRIHVGSILDRWSYVQPYDPEEEARRAVRELFNDYVYPTMEKNEPQAVRDALEDAPASGRIIKANPERETSD